MSYDVYLSHTLGEKTYRIIEVGNMTSNIKPMLDLAFGVEDWKFINGMLGKDALPSIRAALSMMEVDKPKFEVLNPKNGWGSYESCFVFLKQILEACKENPDLTIEISY